MFWSTLIFLYNLVLFYSPSCVSDILRSLDFFHYAILIVFLISIRLAVYTEENNTNSLRLLWFAAEFLPMPLSASFANDVEVKLFKSNVFFIYLLQMYKEIKNSIYRGTLINELTKKICATSDKIKLYLYILNLKRLSTSRRQLLYFIEKLHLGLSIQKGEDETKSYLDIKRQLKKTNIWPFMLDVSNVKGHKIVCKGKLAVPMSSYSYLDFIRDERVQESAILAAREWSTGNHGPRMLGGNTTILLDLEKVVSRFFNRDDALLCATGYLACMSCICALCKKEDLIIADDRIHACIRVGIKTCNATCIYFKHNNYKDCRNILKRNRHKYKTAWMLIESVYSMDGDIADLAEAHKLCTEFNLKLVIDEAHGLGVLGKTGRGLEEHYNLRNVANVIIGTFSKSIGGIGGYITSDRDTIDFLDFHAPGNVFSAPLTAYSAGGAIKAFELMQKELWRIQKVQKNSKYMRNLFVSALKNEKYFPSDYKTQHKYIVGGDEHSSIIPIIVRKDIDRVLRTASAMLDAGYMLSAVAFPACPLETPRLRITATSAYDEKLMNDFVDTFVKCFLSCPPSEFNIK